MIIKKKNSDELLALIVQEIIEQINQVICSLNWDYKVQDSDLAYPPEPEMGDLAFLCFRLSKELRKPANIIAEELRKKINLTDLISLVKNVNGYLNFYINTNKFIPIVLNQVIREGKRYGNSNMGQKKKIMIEFSSPNTNKPLHLGHLRNIVIGWSTAQLLETTGFKVIKASLLNNRGIHICKGMLAYKKWGNDEKPNIKPDHFVGKYYILFEKKAKENPDLQKELLELLNRLEKKSPLTTALWRKLNKWAEKGFEETYLTLDVTFDKVYHESEIYEKGKKVILKGFKKGIFKKDKNGAVIADLEKYGLPNKVLLRADGSAIYITQDIYLAISKFEGYKLEKSIYCVGNEQNLYLKQLFKILELLGYSWVKNCYHLSHGMVFLPEGKMKSREGKVVEADDLISKLKTLACREILERNPNIQKTQLSKKSLEIALGALKYYLLQVEPSKNVYFEPQKSVSFIGKTGPYIQYAYARICSILKKVGRLSFSNIDYSCLNSKEERELVILLAKFPLVVKKSALNYNPAFLAQYLYDLAEKFNLFYEKFPVLKTSKEIKKARLFLISCVKIVINKGLRLLGITTLEKM